MKTKEKYIEICKTKNIPLFSQYFWMDAVCGKDNWDVIFAEEGGNILAVCVFYLNKTDKGMEIRKAPLTQNNGIIYFYPEGLKYDRMISFEIKAANLIIDQLEEMEIVNYRQYFHHTITNWLPFFWRGYNQSTRYTYRIEDTSNFDEVYNNFNGNIRTNIKKAQKHVTVNENLSPNDFYMLIEKTYKRQNIEVPFSPELFNNLYENLTKNDCFKIFYAKDQNNVIHSAALFAFDYDSVYYLMSGSDENYRDSQSLTLLIFEGIKLAHELGKSFDFEGSMKPNIERYFRQFGAIQKPYFDISKNYL